MNHLHVCSRIGDYDVFFEADFAFLRKLADLPHRALVVDRKVFALYRDIVLEVFRDEDVLLVDAAEENKCLDKVGEVYEFLVRRQAKRNLTLISMGGGITQDVTGFAASTLYRGIGWVFIPTTLLAQTDSCIGSKTSLNYRSYKNLIGTFYPPSRVYITTRFLPTLSENDFCSGMGEVIKLQLMKEEYPKDIGALAAALATVRQDGAALQRLIGDSLKVKIAYMANDEFDRGRRNLLNYGHTLGHALETTSQYELPHGTAVTVGMVFANALSVVRGRLAPDVFGRINQALLVPNIPVRLRAEHFAAAGLLECMRSDKKRTGQHLSMVIPDEGLRLSKVDDVTEAEFHAALEQTTRVLLVTPAP